MSNTERYTLELPTTYLNAQGRVCLLEAGTVVVKAGDYDSAQAEVTRLRGLFQSLHEMTQLHKITDPDAHALIAQGLQETPRAGESR